ncbi:MAG: hypothetical protein ACRDTK_19605 [Mycobacterium sp.]
MTVKALATGVASVAAIGAAAIAVTSVAAGVTSAHPAAVSVQPVVLSAPLDPPPPAPGLPTPEQLSGLCTQLTDPGVSYTTKTNLVEGGISPGEGHGADHKLRQAYRNGNFPEQFNVTNIQPAGANATADVTTLSPKIAAPVTQNYTFVNQGGNWIMAHDSALALVQVATTGAD